MALPVAKNLDKQLPRIALAFSGGGVRATVFHLGVLARLARQDLLSQVKIVSSVSGGSLAAGLVFAASGYRWPSSSQYLQEVVPQIHELLTTCDLQRSYITRSMMFPWRIASGRASILGELIDRQWGIAGDLADLPISPRWIINATCYETGKNWRFGRDQMGDYQTKYINNPDFRLSHALAASAAVPGLIGPLVVKSRHYPWTEFRDDAWHPIEPKYKRLHLWDGGVYDNLGVESLFKPGQGLQGDTDFLIVCDASRPLSSQNRGKRFRPSYLKASMRLVDVATDQVRSLRARMLINFFKENPGSGAYLRIGRKSKMTNEASSSIATPSLSDDEVNQAAGMETSLRRLSHQEFSLLFRHGYEVADTTLARHSEHVVQSAQSIVQFKAAA